VYGELTGRGILSSVQVRPPSVPDEPDGPDGPDEPGGLPRGPGGELVFTVPTRVTLLKFGLAALLALLAWAASNRTQTQVGLLVAAAVAVYAARDLMTRQRLRADRSEVVVARGFAGRRRLSWPQIEAVRVDGRTRFGARTELLEIDAGEEIYQFSRFDLGADPTEVARALEALRVAGR
jgi:hypothetical protein